MKTLSSEAVRHKNVYSGVLLISRNFLFFTGVAVAYFPLRTLLVV